MKTGFCFFLVCAILSVQWLNHPTPGTSNLGPTLFSSSTQELLAATIRPGPNAFRRVRELIFILRRWRSSFKLLEYVCAENEKDHKHLVGTVSDSKPAPATVAPEVLSQYVGSYEFAFPDARIEFFRNSSGT
jgi:hypothetical protein